MPMHFLASGPSSKDFWKGCWPTPVADKPAELISWSEWSALEDTTGMYFFYQAIGTPTPVEVFVYDADFAAYLDGALPAELWTTAFARTAPTVSAGKVVADGVTTQQASINTVLSNDQTAEVTGIVKTLAGAQIGATVRQSLTEDSFDSVWLQGVGANWHVYLGSTKNGVVAYSGPYVTTAACTGVRIHAVGSTLVADAYVGDAWVLDVLTRATVNTEGKAGFFLGGYVGDSLTNFKCNSVAV